MTSKQFNYYSSTYLRVNGLYWWGHSNPCLFLFMFSQTWSGRGQGVRMSLIKAESHFWNYTVWVILKQPHPMRLNVLVGLLFSPAKKHRGLGVTSQLQFSQSDVHRLHSLPTSPYPAMLAVTDQKPLCFTMSSRTFSSFLALFGQSSEVPQCLFLLWTHFVETLDHPERKTGKFI